MPNCFHLVRKGEDKATNLQDIDREICQNLGFTFSEDEWANRWYGNIGLMLSVGKTFPQIIDMLWDCEAYNMLRIAAYLSENYTADAWYEHGWR